jgi:hypothetical protein
MGILVDLTELNAVAIRNTWAVKKNFADGFAEAHAQGKTFFNDKMESFRDLAGMVEDDINRLWNVVHAPDSAAGAHPVLTIAQL